jgi:hypothetical protein
MEEGIILFTKDGRKIGNAIVIQERLWENFCDFNSYKIKTDFGNICWLTEDEIDELFYWDESKFESSLVKRFFEQIRKVLFNWNPNYRNEEE